MSSLAVAFTDAELDIVLAAARPLAPSDRDAFLQLVAVELRNAGSELGPSAVYRICAELQRRFVHSPDLDLGPRQSKYRC